jgi:uncharacterized delta-60 repeat protein
MAINFVPSGQKEARKAKAAERIFLRKQPSMSCVRTWRPLRAPAVVAPPAPAGPLRVNAPMVIDPLYTNRVVDFAGGRDSAYYITEMPQGYVMIGPVSAPATQPAPGPTQTNFGATRVNKITGALDTSYGIGGKTVTSFPGFGTGTDVPVSGVPVGSELYVLGSAQFGTPAPGNLLSAVAKLTTDGFLSNTFGSDINGAFNGGGLFYQDLDFRGVNDEFFRGVIDKQGRLLATGFSNPNQDVGAGPPFNFGLARILPNGTFDISFGTNGRVITDLIQGSDDRPNAIIMQGDKIVVGGRTKNLLLGIPPNTLPFSFGLVRYNSDGSIDETFGNYAGQPYNNLSITKGIVINNFGNPLVISPSNSMIIKMINVDPDDEKGKFLALGRHGNNIPNTAPSPTLVTQEFIAVRYLADGMPDKTFGSNGVVTVGYRPGGVFEQFRLVDFQDGFVDPVTKYIYMVGRTQAGTTAGQTGDNSPMIVRLSPNGQPDPTFGNDPNNPGVWVLTPAETGYASSIFRSVFVDYAGNVIVSGEAGPSATADYFSMKFNPVI